MHCLSGVTLPACSTGGSIHRPISFSHAEVSLYYGQREVKRHLQKLLVEFLPSNLREKPFERVTLYDQVARSIKAVKSYERTKPRPDLDVSPRLA
ncbi:hypothetical protein IF1G_03690 [Cordyceps javanica]|uniref:Uncharacterized protein n=1 Tax=Cordyceps javanica TaxID=43265 RepID=A0A545V892_9HYPO|nr:hypothetical protein IF1G_03690 [Cordyceps javanica]